MEKYVSIYKEASKSYKIDKQRGKVTLLGNVLNVFNDNYLDIGRDDLKEVDISDLEWSNTSKEPMLWMDAVDKTPSGYRLPTIYELYSAQKQNISGFENEKYWSINAQKGLGGILAYNMNMYSGWFSTNGILNLSCYVRYVKIKSSTGSKVKDDTIDTKDNSKKNENSLLNFDYDEILKSIKIKNLEWSDTSSRKVSFASAIKKIPSGYRLPTIWELYSGAYYDKSGFQNGKIYWSSTTDMTTPNRVYTIIINKYLNSQTMNISGEEGNAFVRYIKK